MAISTVEKCIVCKRKTYGAILCSLDCFSKYSSNKSMYRRKKPIVEITSNRREKAIENLQEANRKRSKEHILTLATRQMSYWDHLRTHTSE